MAKTKTKGTAKTVSDTPVPQPITIRSTNPKIMADNILKLEESIKAADVSANPSGEAEETLLTSIGIDGKKYNIGASAENVTYDNTDSGLTADDVQDAIDEVNAKFALTELTVPSPTTSGNSYTYTFSDLDKYSMAILVIKASGYDTLSAETVGILPYVKYVRQFTDDNAKEWCYKMEINKTNNTVIVTSLAGTYPADQFLKTLDKIYVL